MQSFKFQDINGQEWFRITGSFIGSESELKTANGTEICRYRKKILSVHSTAYITINEYEKLNTKRLYQRKTMVVATIKRHSNFSFESSADIYIHNPPVSMAYVTTIGLPVAIHVEGDITSKKYDFIIGKHNRNPYKIAQVVRKFKLLRYNDYNDSYFIEIGPHVDIAFICFCAYAIDELFSDN